MHADCESTVTMTRYERSTVVPFIVDDVMLRSRANNGLNVFNCTLRTSRSAKRSWLLDKRDTLVFFSRSTFNAESEFFYKKKKKNYTRSLKTSSDSCVQRQMWDVDEYTPVISRRARFEEKVELRVAFLRKYVFVVLLSGLRCMSRSNVSLERAKKRECCLSR